MKKSLNLILLGTGILVLFSFMVFSNSEKALSDAEFNLDQHMERIVFKEIGILTGYDARKSYSRCPSGLSYSEDQKSNSEVAYGTIYNAEGCSREPFCQFKVMIAEKKTFLKKTPNEPFIAMSDFVKREQDKRTAKF
ncbi:MAG: hypothetical protein IPM77_00460 [Crocinitomicaceae bacterium]|nr:hypothetical protein [Crocinitomicaceae bacterium]MBL7898796.1 hypothetical protein [Crocinitomicaceae bacterium]